MVDRPQSLSQQNTNDAAKIKKYLFIGGVIFVVLGIIFVIYGLLGIPGLMSTTTPNMYDMPNGFNQTWDSLNQSYRDAQQQYNDMRNRSLSTPQFNDGRMFFFPLGGMLIMVGLVMIYYSQLRRITSYMATETAPAVTTTTHAAGDGLMTGINEAGGIKINMANQGATKEIIKVKCPHCGYLESEDAEFCSKCGNKI